MTLAEKRKIKAEEKKLEKEEARAKFRLNQIKPTTNACFNILFVLLSFVCLFPVFYVFMISVSSTDSITKYGYRLFPDTYSTAAYNFLWNERGTIFNSLIISVVVTVMGTVLEHWKRNPTTYRLCLGGTFLSVKRLNYRQR